VPRRYLPRDFLRKDIEGLPARGIRALSISGERVVIAGATLLTTPDTLLGVNAKTGNATRIASVDGTPAIPGFGNDWLYTPSMAIVDTKGNVFFEAFHPRSSTGAVADHLVVATVSGFTAATSPTDVPPVALPGRHTSRPSTLRPAGPNPRGAR